MNASKGSGLYASPLQDHPEYAHAIGMLTIEIAVLERMLANLLGAVLDADANVAEALYLSPRGALARVDILANAAEARLKFRPNLLNMVRKFTKRAEAVIGKRHRLIHAIWLKHPETKKILINDLSGKQTAPRPIHVSEINSLIDDARRLIVESTHIVTPVQRYARSWKPK